jgi:hypothetical protein
VSSVRNVIVLIEDRAAHNGHNCDSRVVALRFAGQTYFRFV